jgi:MoaA/NifB/PqqE/SkfB family radical SAM enzyme
MISDYNKYAHWVITDTCNFNCVYCCNKEKTTDTIKRFKSDIISLLNYHRDFFLAFSKIKWKLFKKTAKINISSLDKATDFFDNTGRWLIRFTGGEPFLFPNFLYFAEKLTRKHFISVDTNLSQDINEFCLKIKPDRVKLLFCSLHILEREKRGTVQDFLNKVKTLKNKGYNVVVNYVMYPPLLKRFKKDYEYFKKEGIILDPLLFKGFYCGKIYPAAYTSSELQLMGSYNQNIKPKSSFKGTFCPAGKDSITIYPHGTVYRCDSDRNVLGNIYKGKIRLYNTKRKCTVNNCMCPEQRPRFKN